jgi:hypothetical protein
MAEISAAVSARSKNLTSSIAPWKKFEKLSVLAPIIKVELAASVRVKGEACTPTPST